MIIFGIGFVIIALFLLGVLYIFSKEREDIVITAVFGALCFAFIVGSISCSNKYFNKCFHPSITPIDVYRGKTTLEITYKDGIAIDSIVVWKEE